mgnify:CR=1 FL=1|tara:strand:+ start:236 stop:709 length:474 start_codon:yes stop_codon:yes gene_type:complete
MVNRRAYKNNIYPLYFIFFSCTLLQIDNNYKRLDNKVYLGSSSAGILQKVSEEVLFDYNFKIVLFEVNPGSIIFETNWRTDYHLNDIRKHRIRFLFNSLNKKDIEINFKKNIHDLYIEMNYQIYDGSSWKEVDITLIEKKLLSEIVKGIKSKIVNIK